MTNILQTLVVAAALIPGTVVASDLALAAESSFYPAHFRDSNLESRSVTAGSGIPPQYRLGD
ncbi:MAG: hypothetical protein PVI61_13710 [Methyloceanibacter sp.]|jgi:hypothetical protein